MFRYVTAAVLVRTADEGARVALVLLALDRAGGAAVGGALVAALLVPHVVAAPAVGLLSDRGRPRVVLTAAAFGFAAALAGTAALLGRVPLPLVVALLVAGGCCGPALTGALTSGLAGLVDEKQRPRAFGADSLTYNVSGIAGPALAAVVAAPFGPAAAAYTLAALATVGAVLIATLPLCVEQNGAPPLTAGVTAVVRDRTLRTTTLASGLGQLGPGALPVVVAVLAAREHSPSATGWLMAAVAAGGLVGSLLWTWRPVAPSRTPMAVMVGLVAVGTPLALAAVTPSVPLVGVLLALSGVALGPFTGALFTARERYAPDGVRAQVFTIGAGLKTTAAAAGAAIAGAVAGLPTAALFGLVGAVPALAGAAGAAGLLRMGWSERGVGCTHRTERRFRYVGGRRRPVAHGRSPCSVAATATHSAPITKK